MLRKSNEKVGYSAHFADAALVNVDPAIARMVEVSQRMDAESAARSHADYERKMRANQELQGEQFKLGEYLRRREQPNHTKQSLAGLDKQIEAQRAKIDRLIARSTEAKAAPKNYVARMETSRILKVIEKAGFRPHRLIKVDVPKVYAATDTLSAIASVREHIAELHAREDAIARAYLTRDEAKQRAFRDVRKNSQRAESFPLLEYAVARKGHDGRLFFGNVEFPQALFFQAIETHVCAYFEDRIDAMYDKLEADGEFSGVEFLTMEKRRREQRELKAQCDQLERIEGALLRAAYLEGHEVPVRADADPANIFPLEIDPDAEWEAPPSGEIKFQNARKLEAQAV